MPVTNHREFKFGNKPSNKASIKFLLKSIVIISVDLKSSFPKSMPSEPKIFL